MVNSTGEDVAFSEGSQQGNPGKHVDPGVPPVEIMGKYYVDGPEPGTRECAVEMGVHHRGRQRITPALITATLITRLSLNAMMGHKHTMADADCAKRLDSSWSSRRPPIHEQATRTEVHGSDQSIIRFQKPTRVRPYTRKAMLVLS